jgi:hypothetical protein
MKDIMKFMENQELDAKTAFLGDCENPKEENIHQDPQFHITFKSLSEF